MSRFSARFSKYSQWAFKTVGYAVSIRYQFRGVWCSVLRETQQLALLIPVDGQRQVLFEGFRGEFWRVGAIQYGSDDVRGKTGPIDRAGDVRIGDAFLRCDFPDAFGLARGDAGYSGPT